MGITIAMILTMLGTVVFGLAWAVAGYRDRPWKMSAIACVGSFTLLIIIALGIDIQAGLPVF